MRVLLIHQAFACLQEAGGTRHFEFARHLAEKGHEVVIVAGTVSYLTGRRMGTGRDPNTGGGVRGMRVVRALSLPCLRRGYVWRVFAFACFMITSLIAGLRQGHVDLVMGTTPPIFQAGTAWVASLCHRSPFLLEVRDLWPDFAVDIGILKNPLLIKAARWFERFLYNRATHIMVNSPAYKGHIVKKGVPATKITLIANGADTSMFEPHADGRGIREHLGLKGRFVVTYAGALGMANDIDTILRAAGRLLEEPDIRFLIVGDGRDRDRLEGEAARRGLCNVTFAGFYPKEAMGEVLAASDACVATLRDIPMFRTTYPNKVFDYMAAARPVILCIDGVIRSLMEEARAGICVHPGDDAGLASAIRRIARDPERAAAMGRAGRRFVEKHFNRKKQAGEFAHLAEGLAHGTAV
ncbi:MAG: glycosyltransferase family 4 protein [bacterium]